MTMPHHHRTSLSDFTSQLTVYSLLTSYLSRVPLLVLLPPKGCNAPRKTSAQTCSQTSARLPLLSVHSSTSVQ